MCKQISIMAQAHVKEIFLVAKHISQDQQYFYWSKLCHDLLVNIHVHFDNVNNK